MELTILPLPPFAHPTIGSHQRQAALGDKAWLAAEWCEARELFDFNGAIYNTDGTISATDLAASGASGAGFLSALAALADAPHLVRALFLDHMYEGQTAFTILLFHRGRWTQVAVDAFFPVNARVARPVLTHALSGGLWVLLLEKAAAKLAGSYQALSDWTTAQVLQAMTGAPTEVIHHDDATDMVEAWEALRDALGPGNVATARPRGHGRHSSLVLAPHLHYHVLAAAAVDGHQVVKLKNPWSATPWEGDWSDASPLWTEARKAQLGWRASIVGGEFWMSLADFYRAFREVVVSRVYDHW